MGNIPPNCTDDHSCSKVENARFQYSLWSVLGFVALSSLVGIGSVFIFKYSQQYKVTQVQVAFLSKRPLPGVSFFSQDLPVQAEALGEDKATSLLAADLPKPVIVTIRRHDTLAKIFKRVGLNEKSAAAILALKQAKDLKNLHSGKKISLACYPAKAGLRELNYEIDNLSTLIVTAKNKGWSAKIKHIEPTVTTKYAMAAINGSVYGAGKKIGISPKTMSQLVNAFNYQVSVNKVTQGSLTLCYKEYTVGGKKVRDSEIVAAELVYKGSAYRIISFTNSDGLTNFYTPDGRSIQPSFTRYPITGFKRIGSHFSAARPHPILGVVRPHLGVDFVATIGSPVKATSNGKVVFAGYRGGYGRAVIIKRGMYSTLYAHLSRFSANIRPGQHITQGTVIGYVGSSGLSTNPHLHYEFRINGIPHDPLKVKLPRDEMIEPKYRSRFFALSKRVLAQLAAYNRNQKIIALSPAQLLSDAKESLQKANI